MVKPSEFILTTDFATYKNDANGTLTLTIPGSQVIAPSSRYANSSTITLGTKGAPARTFINSSASPNNWFFGPTLQVAADGNDSIIGPVQYFYIVYITRNSPDTITMNVEIPNYGFGVGTLTTEPTARTITVKAATFIPPFS